MNKINILIFYINTMPTLYEVAEKILSTHRTLITVVFFLVVFSLAAFFLYRMYYANYIKQKSFSDVANADTRDQVIQVYFFFADWCPHCQTAKPDWGQFEDTNNGKSVNSYVIETISIDCTSLEENPETANMVKKFDVNGFPTVFAVKNGVRVDYDAKVEISSLNQYLQAITK